jgi:hypothetical protein
VSSSASIIWASIALACAWYGPHESIEVTHLPLLVDVIVGDDDFEMVVELAHFQPLKHAVDLLGGLLATPGCRR